MQDFDLNDNKYNYYKNTYSGGEILAEIAYGKLNTYLNCSGNYKRSEIFKDKKKFVEQHFVEKHQYSKYLNDLEDYEFEKELNYGIEDILKQDLELEASNYNSRLNYSIENDFVELDLCCENITWKERLWDGEKCFDIQINDNQLRHFSLYDIYVKIEKTNGEFVQKDLLNFMNFKIDLSIGLDSLMQKDFFTMCFFELIQNEQIQIEPNILYFKGFTFENMKYGIPNYLLESNDIKILSKDLNEFIHSNYKIDIILSGKNLSKIDINPDHLFNGYNQMFVGSQVYIHNHKINSGEKIKFYFDHPSSLFMFFLFDMENFSDDYGFEQEFTNPSTNSFGIEINNQCIWWDEQEFIKIDFMGILLCVICIDPQLKDYKKFCEYSNSKFDTKTLKSINLSRIDTFKTMVEYDSYKKYLIYINALYVNIIEFTNGKINLIGKNL
jgi:hypothetical protein